MAFRTRELRAGRTFRIVRDGDVDIELVGQHLGTVEEFEESAVLRRLALFRASDGGYVLSYSGSQYHTWAAVLKTPEAVWQELLDENQYLGDLQKRLLDEIAKRDRAIRSLSRMRVGSGQSTSPILEEPEQTPDNELIQVLEKLKNLMVSVSTGGPRIDSVNLEYCELYSLVDEALSDRGIENPIPYHDLWEWYGRWSSGDLPSYQSRRQFLAEVFNPILARIRNTPTGLRGGTDAPTGWATVDRTIGEVRKRLEEARTEEHFQAVGLLCREALISLAESVYAPARHRPIDGVTPSTTDAKRRLEAFITAEFPGASHEVARKHAKASVDLAVELQHRRTASFRDAALCAEATSSVVNVIAIVDGKRDP